MFTTKNGNQTTNGDVNQQSQSRMVEVPNEILRPNNTEAIRRNTFTAPILSMSKCIKTEASSAEERFILKIKPEPYEMNEPYCSVVETNSQRISLTEVNQFLVCTLCAGYLIDAMRIVECHHVFCKSCIVCYVQKHNECPTCGIEVGSSLPLLNLRLDTLYQDLVYKLLPNLRASEEKRIREFYENKKKPVPKKDVVKCARPKTVELLLEPGMYHSDDDFTMKSLSTENIRCPENVKIMYLCALVRKSVSVPFDVAIFMYCGDTRLKHTSDLKTLRETLWKDKALPINISYRGLRIQER